MANNARLILSSYSGVEASDIGGFLQVTLTTNEEAIVTDLISEIETEFASRCGRNFAFQTNDQTPTDIEYEETIDANVASFYPKNTPLKEIKNIVLDGTESEAQLNSDYFIYPEYVEFYNKLQSSNNDRRAVTITYTIEKFWNDDVKLLIKRWVALLWQNAENAGTPLISRSFASLSENFDNKEFEKYIGLIVTRYQKLSI